MDTPLPGRAEIHKRMVSIPLVEADSGILDEPAVLAATYDLELVGSQLLAHAHSQAHIIYESVTPDLDQLDESGDFIIPANVLFGIISRASLANCIQTASDLGYALHRIQEVRMLFEESDRGLFVRQTDVKPEELESKTDDGA